MTHGPNTENFGDVSSSYESELFGRLSGRHRPAAARIRQDYPLIVALHGGTFNSRYFDVPDFSLLQQAALLGLPILAPDRPGYGESLDLDETGQTLAGNAAYLRGAISDAWRQYRQSARGIVLVGHSIGAAIAMLIASETLAWPLLGIAISGLGLRTPAQSKHAISALPDIPKLLMPSEAKDQQMFGPSGSFDSRVPTASRVADAPVPRTEIVEIATVWENQVHRVAAKVRVPVHYRQAEFDRLWVVSPGEIEKFGSAFSSSPWVDSAMMPSIGHCIDFHHNHRAFQRQQLGFALACAALRETSPALA